MGGFHAAHLIALGAWLGLVLAEVVTEVAARRNPAWAPTVALLHKAYDLYVEIPILAAVVISGVLLFLRTPYDALLGLKVVCGLFAVGINVVCIFWVLGRARAVEFEDDDARRVALESGTRRVFLAFYLGFPAATAALIMGGLRAGWW